eukprot:TRINITY_DN91853_c0_g1_i1.p1 TRINITY_DN91853_c0_g1~~TRINITY_DN91853_c0_g1_i1.p1  ORF type:complete len:176 (+),score=24.98 TRINITY_DN91853_c0_g1_i1:63-590(+)
MSSLHMPPAELAADYEDDDPLDDVSYEEALELNRRLREMLADQSQRVSPAGAQDSRQRGRSMAASTCSRFGGGTRAISSGYAQQAMGSTRPGVSSHSINRRRFQERVQKENAGIASRLVAQASGRGSVDSPRRPKPRGQDRSLPPGWTRGVGGRKLPPPKQRWSSRTYDAGEWNS